MQHFFSLLTSVKIYCKRSFNHFKSETTDRVSWDRLWSWKARFAYWNDPTCRGCDPQEGGDDREACGFQCCSRPQAKCGSLLHTRRSLLRSEARYPPKTSTETSLLHFPKTEGRSRRQELRLGLLQWNTIKLMNYWSCLPLDAWLRVFLESFHVWGMNQNQEQQGLYEEVSPRIL